MILILNDKPLNEKTQNLFLDMISSTNWGVEGETYKVDSDDEILQTRIEDLNTDEHKLLGECLMTYMTKMVPQGSK